MKEFFDWINAVIESLIKLIFHLIAILTLIFLITAASILLTTRSDAHGVMLCLIGIMVCLIYFKPS